jgi:hypothetical protein
LSGRETACNEGPLLFSSVQLMIMTRRRWELDWLHRNQADIVQVSIK